MSLPTFVSDEAFTAPGTVTLGEDAAHHMRVRRLETGVRVGLVDGHGLRGAGVLTHLAKRHASVSVERVELVEPASPVHLMLPVADRDRMLWLAEKCTELELTSWRPVLYRRSKHVNPRGEGTTFQQKVRARMTAALEQCQGAFLPALYPEASLEAAIAAAPAGVLFVLEQGGAAFSDVLASARGIAASGSEQPVTLAIGPEGGFEESELAALTSAGFIPVSIGRTVLRFETAGLAAVASVRAKPLSGSSR